MKGHCLLLPGLALLCLPVRRKTKTKIEFEQFYISGFSFSLQRWSRDRREEKCSGGGPEVRPLSRLDFHFIHSLQEPFCRHVWLSLQAIRANNEVREKT